MGRLFGWLNRSFTESSNDYQNRINRLPVLHAGYIFLDKTNYHPESSSFALFAEWNGELNSKLQDALPQGGYYFQCSPAEAEELCKNNCGIPVYCKLYAKSGRLLVKRLFFKKLEKEFEVHFNGCEVTPPEMVYFMGLSTDVIPVEDTKNNTTKNDNVPSRKAKNWWLGSGKAIKGSYHIKTVKGSYSTSYRKNVASSGSRLRSVVTSYSHGMGMGQSNNNNNNNNNGSYRGSGRLRISGSYRIASSRSVSSGLRSSYHTVLGSFRMDGSEIVFYPVDDMQEEISLGYGLHLI